MTSKNTFPLPCLALITDRKLCANSTLEQNLAMAIRGGVNLVQLREKDLPIKTFLQLAQSIRSLTKDRAFFVVNERIKVAMSCEADAVQLGEEAISVKRARHIIGSTMMIGRSVHSLEGALEAEHAGADFLILGTIFKSYPQQTQCKGGAGIKLVSIVSEAVKIPVIAIGGITPDNAGLCIQAGASGIAAITAILGTPDVNEASKRLWKALEQNWVKHQ